MKKIETLQELEAEVLRLTEINTSLILSNPEISDVWFRIENVSIPVLYEAKSLFNSAPTYSNGKLRLQYCNSFGSKMTLFAFSIPAARTMPSESEFAEAS